MTKFEQAVLLSYEDWAATIPEEFEPFEPSKKHIKKMEKLFDKMRGGTFHRLTRGAARTLLVAAILLLAATIAIASPAGRSFIVEHFDGFSTYTVAEVGEKSEVGEIELGYVPEGFELTEKQEFTLLTIYSYSNNNDWFDIKKTFITDEGTFNNEYLNEEIIELQNTDYVYYYDKELRGIMWNDGEFIYAINGNISKEELLQIASNVE